MYDENFNFALERYKKELLEFAKKNKVTFIDVPNQEATPTMADVSEETDNQSETENENFYPPTTNYEIDFNPPMTRIQDVPLSDLEEVQSTEYEVKRYNTYDEYLNDNPKSGSLRVQAFVAGRAFPVSNVKVRVTKEIGEQPYTIAERMTDSSGIAGNIILPAPESNLSETPVTTQMPYATYDVLIEQPRYVTLLYKDVPIFDSIESIQPVEMRPRIDGVSNNMIVIDEKSEWNLSQGVE